MAPNQVSGTVSTSEAVVALRASAGFLLALGSSGIAWGAIITLLVGGVVAAPIAAWAVSRLDHRILGGLVGGMILLYNAEGVLGLVGLSGDVVTLTPAAIVGDAAALSLPTWLGRTRPADVAMDAHMAPPA